MRDRAIQIRVSDDEHAALTAAAAVHNTNVSTFLREAALVFSETDVGRAAFPILQAHAKARAQEVERRAAAIASAGPGVPADTLWSGDPGVSLDTSDLHPEPESLPAGRHTDQGHQLAYRLEKVLEIETEWWFSRSAHQLIRDRLHTARKRRACAFRAALEDEGYDAVLLRVRQPVAFSPAARTPDPEHIVIGVGESEREARREAADLGISGAKLAAAEVREVGRGALEIWRHWRSIAPNQPLDVERVVRALLGTDTLEAQQ